MTQIKVLIAILVMMALIIQTPSVIAELKDVADAEIIHQGDSDDDAGVTGFQDNGLGLFTPECSPKCKSSEFCNFNNVCEPYPILLMECSAGQECDGYCYCPRDCVAGKCPSS